MSVLMTAGKKAAQARAEKESKKKKKAAAAAAAAKSAAAIANRFSIIVSFSMCNFIGLISTHELYHKNQCLHC